MGVKHHCILLAFKTSFSATVGLIYFLSKMKRSKNLSSFIEESIRHKLSGFVDSSRNPFVTESTKEWILMSRNVGKTPEDHPQNMLAYGDLNMTSNIKEYVSSTKESVGDLLIDYILSVWIVKLAIDILCFWIATTILVSIISLIIIIIAVAPFSIVGIFAFTAISVIICLSLFIPFTLILTFPLLIIGTISSFLYVLLY